MTKKITKLSSASIFDEYVSFETFMTREGIDFRRDKQWVLEDHVLQKHQGEVDTTYCVKSKSRKVFVFSPALLESFTKRLLRSAAFERFVAEYSDLNGFLDRKVLRYTFDDWASRFGNVIVKDGRDEKQKKEVLLQAKDMALKTGVPTCCRMQLDSDTGAMHSDPEYPCWILDVAAVRE